MIENFSSFIEFLSAIYFSLYIEDLINRRIWTPAYYKQLYNSLDKVTFIPNESIKNYIVDRSKCKGEEMQKQVSHKGLFMLIMCSFTLLFIGLFCEEQNVNVRAQFALSVSCLFIPVITLFGKILLSKWKYVILFAVFELCVFFVSYRFLYIRLDTFVDSKSLLEQFFIQYHCYIVLFALLFPIGVQIIVCWLYSSIYSGYLNTYLIKEQSSYDLFLKAQKEHDSNQVPEHYKILIANNVINNGSFNVDSTLSDYSKKIINDLKKIVEPNLFILFWSHIVFVLNKLYIFLKTKVYHLISWCAFSSTLKESIPEEFKKHTTGTVGNNQPVDYKKEYLIFCQLKLKDKSLSLSTYCQNHNINYDAMRFWIANSKKESKTFFKWLLWGSFTVMPASWYFFKRCRRKNK